MSVNEHDPGAPIAHGSPLGRALDAYAVPSLSLGFADRLVAAAEARPAPLSALRRPRRGWWLGQRLAIGVVSFGALATAAAATGLLQQFDLPVPSAEKVWARMTGEAPAAVVAPAPVIAAGSSNPAQPLVPASVEIVGPIDTPEELNEAFRRIDDVRQGRLSARSERIDQRIASAIERRRTLGLRVPTAEQEAAVRERIAAAEARRQEAADARIAARREALQRKIDNGEALTRKDIAQRLREDAQALRRLHGLRQWQRLSPDARRAALRRLPPEERRALVEAYRARDIAAAEVPVPGPSAATQGPMPEPSPARTDQSP